MAIFDSKSAAGKCQANRRPEFMLSKQSYVAINEAITVQRGDQSPKAKKAPEGQFRRRLRLAPRQQNHTIESRRKCAGEERKNRRPETKESRNHREQLNIPHPHPFAVANGFIQPSDQQ